MKRKKASKKFSDIRKYWPDKTLEECQILRQEMFDRQDGRCWICRKPESHFAKKLAIDHSHDTGKVRGLLCYRDNRFKVGKFTLKTILPVMQYLVAHELEGDLCQIYGEMLEVMKADIK